MTSILKVDSIQNAAGTAAMTINASTGKPSFPNGATLPAGSVVQVVTNASENNSGAISSASYVAASGLTASITPSSANSKILVLVNTCCVYGAGTATEGFYTIYRGTTDLGGPGGLANSYTGSSDYIMPMSMQILDSPASSSSVTYAVYMKRAQGSGVFYTNLRLGKQSVTLIEIAQ